MSENLELNQIPEKHQINQEPAKRKKKTDFWLGFIGGLIINVGCILIVVWANNNPNLTASPALMISLYIFPWVLNISAIILALRLKRSMIAIGILSVYAVGLLLGFISGVVAVATCFYVLSLYR